MTQKSKNSSSDQQKLMIIGGVIAAAVIVAIAFIVLSSQSSLGSASIDYSQIPQERQPDGGFVLGDPNAPVTIVAFEDFLCSHCQQYQSTINPFIEKYVATGMARFEYRFMPVISATYSPLVAKYTECSDTLEPGSFWKAHDVMFDLVSSSAYSNSTPETFANRMGISYAKMLECSTEVNQVQTDATLGQQLGVSGTPTIMVRYGDSTPQLTQYGSQPTFEQLGMIVAAAGVGQ